MCVCGVCRGLGKFGWLIELFMANAADFGHWLQVVLHRDGFFPYKKATVLVCVGLAYAGTLDEVDQFYAWDWHDAVNELALYWV